MKTTYIFGHKKPDTDSICGSISLAYLKNKLGIKSEAMTLGSINNETKFALNYFNLKEPKYLNDVKLQIKDVDYIKNCFINENQSIHESYLYMKKNSLSGLPIVDNNKKLTGLVTLKDLAKELIQGDFNHLNTSYDNIVSTLGGKEVLKFDEEIKGNIMAASFRSTTFLETIKLSNDDILIVGDRHSILEYAVISKVKLIIIVGSLRMNESHYDLAIKNKVNIIKTPLDTYHTTKLINLSNYIKSVSSSNNPISLEENDYYSDFMEIANKTKYTNYPIINKKDECLGLLPLTQLSTKNPKQVILVDHNEKEQSADGLEEAQIVEIIDHHKLGTLDTILPINFRNMVVGSVNTIIYKLFNENEVVIPKSIAGAMLSAILSDTLILSSPTTTDFDKDAVNELEKIAEVDHKEYGLKMFKAGSSLKGKTKEEIIYNDFKNFNYNDSNIGIGQVFTASVDDVLIEKEGYINILNNIAKNDNYLIIALFITDIINNGSYVLFNDSAKELLKDSFDLIDFKQGQYLEKVVSRKIQIIPPILESFEKH